MGDCGLASTPAMFMSTVFASHAFDGAIMLTASHLPFNRNGMKFFTRAGGLDKKDISTILERAEKKGLVESQPLLRTEATELMPDYSAHLLSIIRTGTGMEKPLDGLHIIVDAGNGAVVSVEQILQPLGADTTGSQF